MMRAVMVHGAGDLRVAELEPPSLAPDGVLVDIAYGGICGSDLHYHQHGANGAFVVREPLVLGHEVVGTVAAVGSQVADAPPVGTRVAIHPATPTPLPGGADGTGLHLAAGGTYLGSASTSPHTQGGLVERLQVTAAQLRPLPAGLPLRRAALAEPLAVALHGVDRARPLLEGSDVLVSGAGPIGCLVVAALLHRGARRVTVCDLHARPLEVATAVGAHVALRVGTDPVPQERFDIVIEAAGAVPSLRTALDAARRGGAVVQLGMLPKGELPIPMSDVITKELSLHGSQRFDVELDEAIAILAATPALDAVVTDVFPVSEAADAFSRAADSRASTKTLISFGV